MLVYQRVLFFFEKRYVNRACCLMMFDEPLMYRCIFRSLKLIYRLLQLHYTFRCYFPLKLTNVPWKSMVGSDVFPTEISSSLLKRDEFVRWLGVGSTSRAPGCNPSPPEFQPKKPSFATMKQHPGCVRCGDPMCIYIYVYIYICIYIYIIYMI